MKRNKAQVDFNLLMVSKLQNIFILFIYFLKKNLFWRENIIVDKSNLQIKYTLDTIEELVKAKYCR